MEHHFHMHVQQLNKFTLYQNQLSDLGGIFDTDYD
jgi:hypothetical protein